MRRLMVLALLTVSACASSPSAEPPAVEAAWSAEQSAPILDKTLRIRLAFDDSTLTEGEKRAVAELAAAGERLHALYIDQRHAERRSAEAYLAAHPERSDLAALYRLNAGPIATTLDNKREPFLSVAPEAPGKNVYEKGATRDALEAFIAANPSRRDELLDAHAVVRAATPEVVDAALAALDRHPAIDTLHPGLRDRLRSAEGYVAIPYSVAFAPDMMFVFDRLNAAADHVAGEDPAFARYLRLRARDLIADDYEAGDAAWVTSRFSGNLNAQIGAYETYDDALFGVKAFFSLSLLKRDRKRTEELARAIAGIQEIEDSLPYDAKKRVRDDIPVGVYDVIADFGQSRGANTATILPNDADLTRRYGRTILMRGNILLDPDIYEESTLRAFKAATLPPHHGDLGLEGGFYRTLWHEVGHYLGADRTKDGRDLDVALQDAADALEEMKADLVSLKAAQMLRAKGYFTADQLKGVYASGVRRVLQKSKPRRDQPYQTMQLIQWNWFEDRGLLRFEDGKLAIDYRQYPKAVDSLLKEVLSIQRAGDRAAANAFIDRWTVWDEERHGAVARRMRDDESFRFTLVTYEALGDPAP